ncbi:hypothetical protein DL239_21570, partial [Sedimentitalea sp. CY04]
IPQTQMLNATSGWTFALGLSRPVLQWCYAVQQTDWSCSTFNFRTRLFEILEKIIFSNALGGATLTKEEIEADQGQLSEAVLFFEQRLLELTFHYALDSYKAPTLNSPWIANELSLALEKVESESGSPGSVSHVIDELKNSLSSNIVSDNLFILDKSGYLGFDFQNVQELRGFVAQIGLRSDLP